MVNPLSQRGTPFVFFGHHIPAHERSKVWYRCQSMGVNEKASWKKNVECWNVHHESCGYFKGDFPKALLTPAHLVQSYFFLACFFLTQERLSTTQSSTSLFTLLVKKRRTKKSKKSKKEKKGKKSPRKKKKIKKKRKKEKMYCCLFSIVHCTLDVCLLGPPGVEHRG